MDYVAIAAIIQNCMFQNHLQVRNYLALCLQYKEETYWRLMPIDTTKKRKHKFCLRPY